MQNSCLRSWRGGLSLLGISMLLIHNSATALDEHKLNRSLAVQASKTNIQLGAYDSASKVFCGTACSYLRRSGGKMTSPTVTDSAPSAWPNSATNYPPNPAALSLIKFMPTNETTSNDDIVFYDTDYKQKSEVVLSSSDKLMRAAVQKSGSPSTQVAYHVHVQNQSSSKRDFFVRFKAPANKNYLQAAYEVGGPSGEQPVPVGDNEGLARSSADIYVDGLPVWHTANSIHRKDSVAGTYGLSMSWGEDATNDYYIVYLGRYNSGETFELDYLLQADVETTAPDCGQDFYSYYPETSYVRYCQVMAAGREINAPGRTGATFELLSTATLPLNYTFIELPLIRTINLGD